MAKRPRRARSPPSFPMTPKNPLMKVKAEKLQAEKLQAEKLQKGAIAPTWGVCEKYSALDCETAHALPVPCTKRRTRNGRCPQRRFQQTRRVYSKRKSENYSPT